MSFTLLTPDDYMSLNDSIFWGADSTNSANTNFKYVFDILNSNDELLLRSKIYPEPNSSRGFFDVSSVLRNELDIIWLNTPGNYHQDIVVSHPNDYNNLRLEYKVQAGEEYNVDFSGITTLNMASGTAYAWNYVPNIWERQDNAYDSFNERLLTNRPKKTKVYYDTTGQFNEQLMIGWNTYGIPDAGKLAFYFTSYNSNNVKILNSIECTIFLPDANTFPYAQLDIAPKALNDAAANMVGYDLELVGNTTAYYDVHFADWTDPSFPVPGEKFRVYVDTCKGFYPVYNLHFMNALGMFDTARFSCVDKLQMQLTRKSFSKKDVVFRDAGSGVLPQYYNSNILNETKINYGQDIAHTLKLTMDFPTDEEYQWLSELMYSPLIYLNHEDKYYPVTIKNTNYDYIKRISSKLKTLEVEVELNIKRNAIRR
jgi:hypothetical protein